MKLRYSSLFTITQRLTSKECPDNKAMHFSLNSFWHVNQSVKEHHNAPATYYNGRPDNNYYEANTPHN